MRGPHGAGARTPSATARGDGRGPPARLPGPPPRQGVGQPPQILRIVPAGQLREGARRVVRRAARRPVTAATDQGGASVMVPALKEVDSIVAHEVDESVLLSDPSRPDAGAEVSDGLGLADAPERFSGDRLHEIHDPRGDTTIRGDPEALREGAPGPRPFAWPSPGPVTERRPSVRYVVCSSG